ncbi:hypothetical protein B6D60_11130 [candidate division KSB1 bacterium 4484_87]|nr:MAG: hypothetical protein B6D60_11130 [candidate division KSB1 bacterium 4484_87]
MDYDQTTVRMSMSFFEETKTPDPVPNADIISIETVVNMLVRKGICTAEELFILEGQLQEQNKDTKENKVISIKSDYERGRFPALKRWMSKRRWTRHLGTALFGWKWKKVKKSPTV